MGGGLALTRHVPSPICASYNEVRSFSQTLTDCVNTNDTSSSEQCDCHEAANEDG